MSEEDTTQESNQTQELAAAISQALAPALSQSITQALGPLYQAMQPKQQTRRQPTAADYGLDQDDPYSPQFSSLISELSNMRSENKGLRDQVHNLGVTTMQSQLTKQVSDALSGQNVPKSLHEPFSAVIYSVLQSGQQTTPDAVVNNLMRGIGEYSDEVRRGVAEQAAKPKPPTFRGQELGPEMPVPETMNEAHEMFAELAESIAQGADFQLEPIEAES